MKGGTSSSNRGQQAQSKTEKQSTQGKFQPTAEQVRYAQLLSRDEPGNIDKKIQEVVDLTQKPQDEVAIALHDCDYDVDTAVINLLEGKYNQGEWTTYRTRKKKSAPADAISPVNPKDQAGNSRQEKRDNRDGGSSGLSQSVEYNNRRNKGQMDKISDGNNARQNGPLNTRPPGGGRNRNREDRDDQRGDQDERRGEREDRREERRGERDNRRDRGGDRGEQANDRRSRNDYRDRDRNDRGNRGGRSDRGDRWEQNDRNDRGDRGADRGDRGGDRGDRGGDRADRGGDRGDRGGDRGDRGGDRGDRGGDRGDRGGDRWNGGDRNGDRGDRRFGGRGFNRRGGMGRGGRGGRGSRGGRFPNRSGGRRSEQMNGPSKQTELSSASEKWDISPEKDDNDWGLPEPTGTTEDWGAEDWGSEKQADTTNMPSWATDDQKTSSTWETDVPTNQNLTNHVNHLPEWLSVLCTKLVKCTSCSKPANGL